jgi:hypothetical protein
LSFVERLSTVRVGTAATRRSRHRIVEGSLSAVLGVALLIGPASADPIGSEQARADRLVSQIADGAAQIRSLSRRYFLASDEAASISAQLAHTEAQLQRTQAQVDASRAVLRTQAVTAYINGPSAGSSSGATGAGTDMVVRREYLTLAAGNVTDALDRLRTSVGSLRVSEANFRQSQQAARAAADQVVQARNAAVAEARSEQAVLDQVQGHLVELVAAAQAAKAAQEARAAQQVAAARSRQQALAAARPAPQGLPVNGGLVAAVVAATSPPQGGGGAGGVWASLRQCESGGNYAENTGNGYYGAYQFSQPTWTGLGYPGRPDLAPPAMQDQAAQQLQASSGWGQWPACAAALGLI